MAWSVTADPERFEEADAWFRSRIPYTIEQYDALDDKARKQAFWITAALELNAVQTIFDELAKSNEKGTPFEEFQKNVEEKLGKLAPDGFHLETVYRNWVQKAYNTGRWHQLQDPELTLLRPYLMFDAVLDSRTTPTCKACDGIVKRHDDGFWLTHCPPLHHRCRSSLRSLRAREAQRRGITEGVPEGTDPQDDFGKAPPLTGDDEHLEPKETRFDPEVWAEFKRRQLVMLEELETANQAARAARLIRDQQQPSYWFEREFKTLYGEQAGRAVAWGKAMEHRGLEMTSKGALAEHRKLVRAGAAESPRLEQSIRSVLEAKGVDERDLESALNTVRLRELLEAAAARNMALEAADIQGLAALVGHATAIEKAPGVAVFYDIIVETSPYLTQAKAEAAAKRMTRFYDAFGDKSLVHPKRLYMQPYPEANLGTRGGYIFGMDRIDPGAGSLRTLVHEWAHALDVENPSLAARALEFRERRTQGEPARSLWRLLKDKRYAKEYARRDKFYTPYMGKVYEGGIADFTEVSTMAIESLVTHEPGDMVIRDLHTLYFALGQLAGTKP